MQQSPPLILCSSPITPLSIETLEAWSAWTGIPLLDDNALESQTNFLLQVRERRRTDFVQFLARVVAQKLRDRAHLAKGR
jgi:hypothetical protein